MLHSVPVQTNLFLLLEIVLMILISKILRSILTTLLRVKYHVNIRIILLLLFISLLMFAVTLWVFPQSRRPLWRRILFFLFLSLPYLVLWLVR